MRYPFDLDKVRQELQSIRTAIGESRAGVEGRLGLPAFSGTDIEAGTMEAEEAVFRDYAEYIEAHALARSMPISDNFATYLRWETSGWVSDQEVHTYAIDILEKHIALLEQLAPDTNSVIDGIQDALAVLRKDSAERKGIN